MGFARSLRKGEVEKRKDNIDKPEVVLVLDNVYDTFNVGGMYRVADAAGVAKIYHCGETPTPPDSKIARASVGLYQYLPWEYRKDTTAAVTELKHQGWRIIVLEQDRQAVEYSKADYTKGIKQHPSFKIALVVGNESFGVNKKVIKMADLVVELPMYGINKSLNVVVATGIVVYEIRRQLDKLSAF